jgi:hypothetical protein
MFAALIDELEVDLQDAGLGTEYGSLKIASLLLMDDIVLVADTPEKLQKMLDITYHFACKWHLDFNKTKCRVLICGRGPVSIKNHTWNLGLLRTTHT